ELVALEEVEAASEQMTDQPRWSNDEAPKRNTDLVPSFLARVKAFFLRPQIAYALLVIFLIVSLLWLSSSRRERRELLARLNQPVAQDENARDSREGLAEVSRKIED